MEIQFLGFILSIFTSYLRCEPKEMNCPKCGANVEVTRFNDGSILTRQDCNCKGIEIK